MDPSLTVHRLTVHALSEVDDVLALVVEVTGHNAAGHPLPGLLGWLPHDDLVVVCRAVQLAHGAAGTPFWREAPSMMADDIIVHGIWRHPRIADVPRLVSAVAMWAICGRPEPDRLADITWP